MLSVIGAIRALSLSVVDTSLRHELLHARAEAIHFSAMTSELEHEAQLTAERLQVDNMLPRAACPIVAYGAPSTEDGAPWLQCNATRRKHEKRLRHIGLCMQELQLKLEESLMGSVANFATRLQISPTADAAADAAADAGCGMQTDLEAISEGARSLQVALPKKRPWYVDELQLHALRLLLSYRKQSRSHDARSTWRPPVALPQAGSLPLAPMDGGCWLMAVG